MIPKRPQQINILNGKKIIQVDSGYRFVVVLTDDGLVYLASGDSRLANEQYFSIDFHRMWTISFMALFLLWEIMRYGQLTGNSRFILVELAIVLLSPIRMKFIPGAVE
ncbi:hypothetical protein DERP_012353 [Dermatophagoides pteronyssinus]|uniref:Uncharacterized protein n=1 Tax=Dermatophagoides pteronyssinus TaxID=6956 RepID=A0ABQ8IUI1_DERPT|nr:hypothetical protein DERP_012353 [Dermatophagoides pteronyssinus]